MFLAAPLRRATPMTRSFAQRSWRHAGVRVAIGLKNQGNTCLAPPTQWQRISAHGQVPGQLVDTQSAKPQPVDSKKMFLTRECQKYSHWQNVSDSLVVFIYSVSSTVRALGLSTSKISVPKVRPYRNDPTLMASQCSAFWVAVTTAYLDDPQTGMSRPTLIAPFLEDCWGRLSQLCCPSTLRDFIGLRGTIGRF